MATRTPLPVPSASEDGNRIGASDTRTRILDAAFRCLATTGYTDPVLQPLADELTTRLGKS